VAYPDTLIRIRTRSGVMVPEYLHLVWNSPIVRRQLESMARTTAGIYKVNQKHLESVRIPVPGMEQQKAVSEQVGRVSAAATRLQNELGIATLRAERLRRTLLAAAFSGSLTGRSTDRDDAEELADAGV
jgi:type I restriction enzyme S subunit